MKELAVCGTFDDQGGKASGYMKKLFEISHATVYNGGTWDSLIQILRKEVPYYDIIYWLPNVSNSQPKLAYDVKKLNPWCILITSKSNLENKYAHKDLIARALNTKSALLVEFTEEDGKFAGTVHDPLGNVFVEKQSIPAGVHAVLFSRASQLISFTRVGSVKVGLAIEVPNEERFFNIIKGYADRFHELVHAANSDRLLGNASFRCERGFPSFKQEGQIFVSRRNIDKRFIGREGFVAVERRLVDPMAGDVDWKVCYYGDTKPSVDTPTQILLYEHFKNIKYMLHSHTYIEGAPFTEIAIPCGAVEEYSHIRNMFLDRYKTNFSVNLRGHGSLVLAGDIDYMENIPYIARPAPERQNNE